MAAHDARFSDPADEPYGLEPAETDAYESAPYASEEGDLRPYELAPSGASPLPADVGLPAREPPRRRARVQPVPPDDVMSHPPADPRSAGADPPETPALSGARWSDVVLDPGRRSIGALALVGCAAACIAGLYLWRSQPEAVPVRPSGPAHVAVASPVSPSPREVVIDVSGKVRHPGVVRLPGGSRVVDAIEAAGGVRHGVDTSQLNLARKVVDGEQILVGTTPAPAPGAGAGGLVDINTASADQLEELPDVGPVLAGRIVAYRHDHGGFRSVDELKDVSGIGPKTFADLEDKVQV